MTGRITKTSDECNYILRHLRIVTPDIVNLDEQETNRLCERPRPSADVITVRLDRDSVSLIRFGGQVNYGRKINDGNRNGLFSRQCVQTRQTCSVGISPTRVRVRSPVARVASVEETKPTDKAIFGMVSESPGRNASEPSGRLDKK